MPLLNPDAVERSRWFGESLFLHSTPLDWLRDCGNGAVVLDPHANLRLWLGGVKEITTDTVDLGREVESRFIDPPPNLPRFYVRSPNRRAA